MHRNLQRKIHIIYLLVDVLLIVSVFAGIIWIRFKSWHFSYAKEYLFMFTIWGVLLIGFLKMRRLYFTNRELSIPKEIYCVIKAVFYPSVIIAAAIFLFRFKFFSRQVYVFSFIFLCLGLSLWRTIKRILVRKRIVKGYKNFNVLIVGAGRVGKMAYESIKERPYLGFKVIGFIDDFRADSNLPPPILGGMQDIERICKRYFIDEIFITIPGVRQILLSIIKMAKGMHVGVRVIPDNFEEGGHLVRSANLGYLPVLVYKDMMPHPSDSLLKRSFDVFFSFVGIIIVSPLFFIICVLVKMTSRGPILYKQARVGSRGKIFYMYKFRSMIENAEELKDSMLDKNEVVGGPIFKIKKDPRITPIGRILRAYSLDELPQLFNILWGDMSFVGPRPFPVNESNNIEYRHIPRLNIKPGLTGLAQVKGRSELKFSHWMRWDTWYLNNWSFGLDIKILLMTIPTVFKGKGAY